MQPNDFLLKVLIDHLLGLLESYRYHYRLGLLNVGQHPQLFEFSVKPFVFLAKLLILFFDIIEVILLQSSAFLGCLTVSKPFELYLLPF